MQVSAASDPVCPTWIPRTSDLRSAISFEWMMLLIFLLILGVNKSLAEECGYAGCYLGATDALNVHLVPHTHDDVGWLKTVDEYYFGLRNEFHMVKVEQILDTMVKALWDNPQRRFIYVEMAYLHQWWSLHRNETLRDRVRQLVRQGRLQFVLGAWSMNDEVSTHYSDIIDQHTRGMRFLSQEFGECGTPLVAWQIDPFGHSREQANLFARMGFDAVYFWRLDEQEKAYRERNRELEMVWHASDDADDEAPLFTGIMEDGYYTPALNCFDTIMCGSQYTPKPNVQNFLRYVRMKAKRFASNHVMIPIGGDFQFQLSGDAFEILDGFIEAINRQGGSGSNSNLQKVHAFYSTPACYTLAVHRSNAPPFPIKRHDFLPLLEQRVTAWVGFYTTKPNLKRYVRVLSNLLHVTEQMAVLSGFAVDVHFEAQVDRLRQALGVLQHHDAITGTAKPHVAKDYAKLLSDGAAACHEVLARVVRKSYWYHWEQNQPNWTPCLNLNMSECNVTESGQPFSMILFSGHSQSFDSYFRLPMTSHDAARLRLSTISLEQSSEAFPPLTPVQFQVLPISNQTFLIPERPRNSGATVEVVFPIRLPPLGHANFLFHFATSPNPGIPHSSLQQVYPQEVLHGGDHNVKHDFIENSHFRIPFSRKTGLMDGVLTGVAGNSRPLDGFAVELMVTFCLYRSHVADMNGYRDRSSGAYVFHPEDDRPMCVNSTRSTRIVRSAGGLQEAHLHFVESFLQLVVRVDRQSPFVEVEWTVGPVPQGLEVVLRYSTNWTASNGVFFTDANCRQTMLRRQDQRDFPGFQQTAPVAGNYYPVTCFIGLPDCGTCEQPKFRMAVLNDRSQGGTSVQNGHIEIMVHRTSLVDDGLGVDSPLNDLGVDGRGIIARGKHWLTFSPHEDMDGLMRAKAQQIYHEPVALFSQGIVSGRSLSHPKSGLRSPLPDNVRVLTLDRWKNDSFLLRLEHLYQKSDQPAHLAQRVVVCLDRLFATFQITHWQELTLSANRDVDHLHRRLRWRERRGTSGRKFAAMRLPGLQRRWRNATHISLDPMQIRTFQIWVHYIQ